MDDIYKHLRDVTENDYSSPSPLRKESMYLLALVLLMLMHYNRYADQPYTQEDINDTIDSLPRHRIKCLLNVIKALKTKKHIWDRGLFLTITLKKNPEPVLTLELSNFLRVNYFKTFIKLFAGLTDCKLQQIGKYRYLVTS